MNQNTATTISTRPSAGPPSHPSLETWVGYHAGELPAAERQDLQAHLTRCRQCVDLILDLDAFTAPVAPERTGVSDFERAAVWRALESARKPTYRWAAVAAMAASLMFATLGLASWNGQQRAIDGLQDQIAELEQPRINVPILDLRPSSRQRSARGADATTELPADTAMTLVLNVEEPVEYPDYEIEVTDTTGAAVWSRRGLEASEFGAFHLALSSGSLPAGSYDLRLFGLDGEERDLLEVYPVRLE